MRRDLGVVLLSAAVCLWPVAGFAQGALSAETFAWNAPTNVANVIGYELQWGTGFAQLPLNITEYTVPNFPLAFSQEVGVLSRGPNGSVSITNKIWVANYIAYHEETEDGTNWTVKKEEQITYERKPNSMIRVRLEIKQPSNAGN